MTSKSDEGVGNLLTTHINLQRWVSSPPSKKRLILLPGFHSDLETHRLHLLSSTVVLKNDVPYDPRSFVHCPFDWIFCSYNRT